MKVLIFEFITGGGFAQEDLPESLFNEGMLMLNALITDFKYLPSVKLTVLLDWRCQKIVFPDEIKIIWVSAGQQALDLLPDLIEASDLVWPVAPEIDKALHQISVLIERKNKYLLNSSSQAVAICSDKLLTTQVLEENKVPVVETFQLDTFSQMLVGSWVIKPKDGAGCLNSYFVTNLNEFDKIYSQIEHKENYIIQPYIKGQSLSFSCLFKEGKAWLICCNRQQILIKQGLFKLASCEVNIPINHQKIYQQLINQIAVSIKGLWGYVGIDIIQSEIGNPLVLEINPRLTTSYAGINLATGLNVAETVIKMVDNNPIVRRIRNQQHIINLL